MSKIDLLDYLKRKRTTIQELVTLLKIKSYDEILEYCDRRGCAPITKDQYDAFFPTEVLQSDTFEVIVDTEQVSQTQELTDDKAVKKTRKRGRSKSAGSS
jgi:hypothetical protein